MLFSPDVRRTDAGEQHKRQRKAVKPVFSVIQLKKLTPLFYELAEKVCMDLYAAVRTTYQGDETELIFHLAV